MIVRIKRMKPQSHPIRLLVGALACLVFIGTTWVSAPGAGQQQDGKGPDASQQVTRVSASSTDAAQDPFIKLKTELVVLSLSVTDGLGRLSPA
jgi:hypothetical protein